MTLPPVIRIFFAIDLPVPVKESLGKYIGEIKKKSKSRSIRWTKPENLHITLNFLAEVQADHVQNMLNNVRSELSEFNGGLQFQLGSVQLFPNPFLPRVIVLDVTPQVELIVLSSMIARGIAASHYEIETKPYRAHLTLGRIKHSKDINLRFLTDIKPPPLGELTINEVTLFRSEPHPEGSSYTVIEKIDLKHQSSHPASSSRG
jgi:2'-5' RNA ligase